MSLASYRTANTLQYKWEQRWDLNPRTSDYETDEIDQASPLCYINGRGDRNRTCFVLRQLVKSQRHHLSAKHPHINIKSNTLSGPGMITTLSIAVIHHVVILCNGRLQHRISTAATCYSFHCS